MASKPRPAALLKLAPLAVPSLLPGAPDPASVDTTPLVDTTRMRLSPVVVTYRRPDGSTAMPSGVLNSALVAVRLSSQAAVPSPAYVVTTPALVTLRMRAFVVSVTNTLPDESTATPCGPLNFAEVPVASR